MGMGQGTVNACEGYKMATSKFLPSLVHFVRGFAAWKNGGTRNRPLSHSCLYPIVLSSTVSPSSNKV